MDYKKTADQEIKELKDLIGQLKNVNDSHDNVRDLEADLIIQTAERDTRKLITAKGNVLRNFFFENAVDHHDLYNVNHSELTKGRIHDMLADTIKKIQTA